MMREQDIGFLVIVDNDELLGTLTDRDIVTRAVSEGLDMQSCQGREIMTTDVLCCNESDNVDELAQKMGKHRYNAYLS